MKRFVLGSIMAASLCAFGAFADQLTGYVSESHCGTAHSSPSEANTKCIEKCLKGGSDPVLVSNGKIMKFDADSREKAVALAGKNVTVDGTVSGDTIKVNMIEEAKESK